MRDVGHPPRESKSTTQRQKALAFFLEFLRAPKQIGSVVPSSAFLERRLVRVGAVSRARTVVELGPDGALEDRRFLFVDDGRRLYNGKRDTSLVRTTASWDPDARVLSMTVPSGEPIEAVVVRSRPEVIEVYGDEARAWADVHGRRLAKRLEIAGETAFAYAYDAQPLLNDLAGRAGVRYLHRPANLEDLFIKLTGRELRD